MSHFNVLLMIKPAVLAMYGEVGQVGVLEAAVEDMMMPYKEYGWGSSSPEGFFGKYCEFVDETENYRKEYENEGRDMVVMPDGSFKSPFDKAFKKPGALGVCFSNNPEHATHVVPATLEKREVAFKELYATFEEFCRQYHDREPLPEQGGAYGYYHNPNNKWDWYQIGGRWYGSLRIKPECLDVVHQLFSQGERSWSNENEECDPLMVNVCRVGDIDYAWYQEDAKRKAAENWRKFEQWKERGLTDEAHREICGQPAVLFFGICGVLDNLGLLASWTDEEREEILRKKEAGESLGPAVKLKEFDRETFMRLSIADSGLSAWAVLDDSGWHGKGEMGWWGMSDESNEDRQKWVSEFHRRFLEDADLSTIVVRVDCHI